MRNATLCEYVHVLIPADETRSGTALGVDKRLLAVAKGQDAYQRVLDLGLDWLKRQAQLAYGRDFPALDEGARDTIVQRMATANFNTRPRVFFGRTCADAYFHCCGRPERWRGIARYRGPPQPLGFMGLHAAAKDRHRAPTH